MKTQSFSGETILFMILGVSLLITGCGMTNPPIKITFRESKINNLVLQVHNESDESLGCTLYVSSKTGGLFGGIGINQSFTIGPHTVKELGILETGWTFDPNEEGYIQVDRYQKKAYFIINNDLTYRTFYQE